MIINKLFYNNYDFSSTISFVTISDALKSNEKVSEKNIDIV